MRCRNVLHGKGRIFSGQERESPTFGGSTSSVSSCASRTSGGKLEERRDALGPIGVGGGDGKDEPHPKFGLKGGGGTRFFFRAAVVGVSTSGSSTTRALSTSGLF
eukprot:CAMPEP_0183574120 /NCGR_PEP_ID=MMETSP0371-20130417/132679_1 /TAXON_ID=268820 /ORGANISM="Peridinium aciculiferum, Strain PAER-2" /LENGTH=104 /DNA_ID=CAMNT_0025784161 /DNA_START=129 /DNA_END=441 /DNA_ORIENTATION=-